MPSWTELTMLVNTGLMTEGDLEIIQTQPDACVLTGPIGKQS